MKKYESSSGKISGVEAYAFGTDFILVKFHGSATNYKYSYKSATMPVVEMMKQLAIDGQGLSTYISQHNPDYE